MSMESLIRVAPLTREAFAPYGDVIEVEGSQHFTINGGSTERFHDLARIDVAEAGGRPIVSIFRAQPRALPLVVEMMERHPLASQAFIPLGSVPFLVLVAAPGEALAADDLRAFIATRGQGVNYHRGVWHHPVLPLSPDQDFLVVDRAGEGHNCDEFHFRRGEQATLALEQGALYCSQGGWCG